MRWLGRYVDARWQDEEISWADAATGPSPLSPLRGARFAFLPFPAARLPSRKKNKSFHSHVPHSGTCSFNPPAVRSLLARCARATSWAGLGETFDHCQPKQASKGSSGSFFVP